jgi:hypothetical protein
MFGVLKLDPFMWGGVKVAENNWWLHTSKVDNERRLRAVKKEAEKSAVKKIGGRRHRHDFLVLPVFTGEI